MMKKWSESNAIKENNIKLLNKQRGKKLTGIQRFQEDKYNDDDDSGVVLKFGKSATLAIYADQDTLVVEEE